MKSYILKTYPGLEKFVIDELNGRGSIVSDGLLSVSAEEKELLDLTPRRKNRK